MKYAKQAFFNCLILLLLFCNKGIAEELPHFNFAVISGNWTLSYHITSNPYNELEPWALLVLSNQEEQLGYQILFDLGTNELISVKSGNNRPLVLLHEINDVLQTSRTVLEQAIKDEQLRLIHPTDSNDVDEVQGVMRRISPVLLEERLSGLTPDPGVTLIPWAGMRDSNLENNRTTFAGLKTGSTKVRAAPDNNAIADRAPIKKRRRAGAAPRRDDPPVGRAPFLLQ